ncbi:hypothetical protein EV361DRAFT_953158 [Lentinula raphanica]|uniref:Uncharacterized protein n=1 Tax=Lentinula raphanica TaxID=153919 RepID=A0AA38P141_9AGAR|nr:hypothetical protein F5878DRAFT_665035 [Lentinula raphanica]KAJ3967507.1 hypothetical protein EV361DRAFT_953158 [Lentinula raphanica]
MRFNVVFFIVWLVAVVYTAPVPLRTLMPRDTSDSKGPDHPKGDPLGVILVEIDYDPDGVPKDWGDTEKVRNEKAEGAMKVSVLKALKDHTPLQLPEKDDKKAWRIMHGTLEEKGKADLSYTVAYEGHLYKRFYNQGGWINMTDLIVTLPTEQRDSQCL